MLNRIAVGLYRQWKRWSAAALLKGAKKLHWDEALKWKSADQERAMTPVMSGTEQAIIVLATGEGKSMFLCYLAHYLRLE
jgi:hypothetical protein